MSEPAGEDDVAALRQRIAVLESQTKPKKHRVRSFFAVLLILVAAILTPLGLVAAWTNSQVTDTDRYVATMAPLASDPAIQAAITNRVTDVIMEHLPVETLLEDVAPADRPLLDTAIKKLGGALTDGITGFVHTQVQNVVESDAFATVWVEVNRRAHAAIDKALTGQGGGAVQIKGDTVTLDLAPLIDQVKTRLVDRGLTVASKIPEIHTDFVLVKSDQISKVKTLTRLLDLAGFWVPVLAVLCAVGGVLLARRRRRAVVTAGLLMAGGALVLGIGLTVFRTVYLDKLPASASQDAAAAIYDALVRYLRTAVRMVLALGIVAALAAWLTGSGRRAGWVRSLWTSGIGAVRQTADRIGMKLGPVGPFVHRWKAWLGWGAVCVAALVLVLWSYPTGMVVIWLAIALLGVLAVLEFLDEPATTAPATEPGNGPTGPGTGPGDGAVPA